MIFSRLSESVIPSPSVWRVWIEILYSVISFQVASSPSVWRVWIEISVEKIESRGLGSHPPCGGCGLKSLTQALADNTGKSPSVWRVWIEMFLPRSNAPPNIVTLRVEGVD